MIGDPDEFVDVVVLTVLGLLFGCWFAAMVLQAIFIRTEGVKLGFGFAFLTAFLCLILTRALVMGLYWAVGDVGPIVDMPLQLAITLAVQTVVVMKLYRLPVVRATRIATLLLIIWIGAAMVFRVVSYCMFLLLRSSISPHDQL